MRESEQKQKKPLNDFPFIFKGNTNYAKLI